MRGKKIDLGGEGDSRDYYPKWDFPDSRIHMLIERKLDNPRRCREKSPLPFPRPASTFSFHDEVLNDY
jgi:hypothetical protein